MSTSRHYFYKFETIYKDKIWGGQKVKTLLGKDFSPLPNCGETWELSGVKGNISIVKNGPSKGQALTELIAADPENLLGGRVFEKYGEEFPLLVKFIDANDDLSVQVHPNDELAKARHNSFGKTEMWYIIQADPGSKLISGFNRRLDKDSYQQMVSEGKIMEILNQEDVSPGDVFFLPAGRVHTIGKGLLLAEIQQTSDVTYRIYDFDRTDASGNKRELHLEESVDALDFELADDYKTRYQDQKNTRVSLVNCKYFTTNKFHLDRPYHFDQSNLDSFRIYVCLNGSAQISSTGINETLQKGEVILVPAAIESYTIEPKPEVTLLESYIS